MGSRIILFSFVPLALVFSPSRLKVGLGIALLSLGYLVLLLAGKKHGMGSALFVPPALGLLAACFRTWSGRNLVIILLVLFFGAATAGHLLRPILAEKNKYHESVAYRVENVRFSWHLALEHPWFGIGLWAPREPYLQDYEIKYPFLTKKDFSAWTTRLKTSENNFLTFMADLGFPFIFLYSSAILVILGRLIGRALQPPSGAVFPALALLLPLMGEILHLQVYRRLISSPGELVFSHSPGIGVHLNRQLRTPPRGLASLCGQIPDVRSRDRRGSGPGNHDGSIGFSETQGESCQTRRSTDETCRWR